MPDEQKVAFDGVRYAWDMADLARARLYADLMEMSLHRQGGEIKDDAFTRCLADTWSVIDNLWRLNLLLIRVPGLKRTPEVVLALKAIRQIEAFRHGFQHLDERVRQCAQQHLPLLGVLSWLYFPEGSEVGWSYSLVPGAFRPGTAPGVNPVGKEMHSAIDFVTVTAFGVSVDLTAVLRRAGTLIGGLDAGLRAAVGGEAGGGADFLFSVECGPPASPASNEAEAAGSP